MKLQSAGPLPRLFAPTPQAAPGKLRPDTSWISDVAGSLLVRKSFLYQLPVFGVRFALVTSEGK